MKEIIDFAVMIEGNAHIHNKFNISDGKEKVYLQSVDDLPLLLRKGWLYKIAPMLGVNTNNGKKFPSTVGIDLIFREDLKVEPVEK
ncbi:MULTISPECIES: hypothetical protein [Enterococcus]|uniref:hypothetical protein n=1 Tax=Enterococcus TaxID=1350 RepID=UPI003919C784